MKTIFIILISFHFCNLINAQTKIAIGIAYKDMTMSGCSMFSEAVGYEYKISTSSGISEMRKTIETTLKTTYPGATVLCQTSFNKTVACIIKYKKPIAGYRCTKNSFAVGFGNNQTEAKEAAVKEMKLYYNDPDWQLEKYIQ